MCITDIHESNIFKKNEYFKCKMHNLILLYTKSNFYYIQ